MIEPSILTDQLIWAMISLEQRLLNLGLALLELECEQSLPELSSATDSQLLEISNKLTVNDYR